MREAVNVTVGEGCPKCGAADHLATVDWVLVSDSHQSAPVAKLDIVLMCRECDHKVNGFMPVNEMVELD